MLRQARAFLLGAVFAAVAVGFAYAVPKAIQVGAYRALEAGLEVEATQTPTAEVPLPEDDSEGANDKDNHGAAVSTAAHCDVKGRAHGELVRSIAKDKEATVADAEAACAEAMAAAEASGTQTHGRPDKPAKPDKPEKPAKPEGGSSGGSSHAKGSKSSVSEDEPTVVVDSVEEPSDSPGTAGGNGKGKGH